MKLKLMFDRYNQGASIRLLARHKDVLVTVVGVSAHFDQRLKKLPVIRLRLFNSYDINTLAPEERAKGGIYA